MCQPKDRQELGEILRGAAHPIVQDMIALFDQEFGEIRKEIMMSVVNQEAQNIVQDAIENGALDAAGAAGDDRVADGPAPSADEALAEAEAELAKAVSAKPEPKNVQQSSAKSVQPANTQVEAATPMPGAKTAKGDTSGAAREAETAETPDAEAAVSPDIDVESTPETDTVTAVPETDEPKKETPTTCAETAPTDEETNTALAMGESEAVVSTPDSAFDAACAPKQVEQAVFEIEKGIRKLVDLLSSEVKDQWQHTHEALDQIADSRVKADEASQKARVMLDEIARANKEAEIVRNNANVVRREAKLLREDVKRAKELAETSAAGAELAADRVRQESKYVATSKQKTL